MQPDGLCLGCDGVLHAVDLEVGRVDAFAVFGHLLPLQLDFFCQLLDPVCIINDGFCVPLDVLRILLDDRCIELDELFVVLKSVLVDGQPLKGVGGIANERRYLRLDGVPPVSQGDLCEPLVLVVSLDSYDFGLHRDADPELYRRQIAQSDLLVAVPRQHLHVRYIGISLDGCRRKSVQLVPCLLQQIGFVLRVGDGDNRRIHRLPRLHLRISDPRLPLGLVRRVAVCPAPLHIRKGHVGLQVGRALRRAKPVQAGDRLVGVGYIDSFGVSAVLQDASAKNRLCRLQRDHLPADGSVCKLVVRDDPPLVQLRKGLQHRPGRCVVRAGFLHPVRLIAGDFPSRQQRPDSLPEPHVDLLHVLNDLPLQVDRRCVRRLDYDDVSVVIVIGPHHLKEAEESIHAAKPQILPGHHHQRSGHLSLKAVIPLIVDQLVHVIPGDDLPHPLPLVKQVHRHTHSHLHSMSRAEAGAVRMACLPGVKASCMACRSVAT